MKHICLTIAAFLFFFNSCSPWKDVMIGKGGQDEAIKNSLNDFLHTGGRLLKQDSVFDISIKSFGDKLLVVGILGSRNKVRPLPKDKIGTNFPGFPTRYYEWRNKLFYWYDSTHSITKDIISVLSKYNHIDSINVIDTTNLILGYRIDEREKATQYYFCKSNLLNYKKVRTWKAIGWYKPPKIACK